MIEITTLAAYVYTFVTGIAVAFQLALALGAPLGHVAMAGKYPGKFPPPMRVAAVVQGSLLAGLAVIVLSHSGTWLSGIKVSAAWAI